MSSAPEQSALLVGEVQFACVRVDDALPGREDRPKLNESLPIEGKQSKKLRVSSILLFLRPKGTGIIPVLSCSLLSTLLYSAGHIVYALDSGLYLWCLAPTLAEFR
jgi:hypothetical protein